jgi:hypothetical protein
MNALNVACVTPPFSLQVSYAFLRKSLFALGTGTLASPSKQYRDGTYGIDTIFVSLTSVQTRAGHRLGFHDRAIRDKRRRIRANWSQGVAKTRILSPLQPEPFHSVEDIFSYFNQTLSANVARAVESPSRMWRA